METTSYTSRSIYPRWRHRRDGVEVDERKKHFDGDPPRTSCLMPNEKLLKGDPGAQAPLLRHGKRGRNFGVTDLPAYDWPSTSHGRVRGTMRLRRIAFHSIDEFVLISAQGTPSALGVPSKEYEVRKRLDRAALQRSGS